MDNLEFVTVSGKFLIQTIEALAKEIWTEYFTPIIGKTQVDYMLKLFQSEKAIGSQIEKEGFFYYLLKASGGRNIGYFAIVPKNTERELLLSKFYIRLSERHKGYGKQALKFIEGLARRDHLEKITLTVNKNNAESIEAYKKMGFQKTGVAVKDIGGGFFMDDDLMQKMI